MKSFLSLVVLGASTVVLAQGQSSTTRTTNATIASAMGALKAGHSVTLTVNNRSVAYAPRMIGSMLYVPVRFFAETGQEIVWDGSDMRATVRNQNGPSKKVVEYDAERGQANFRPGRSLRPFYEKGRLWVPLASGLASFDLIAEWVPASNRINVRAPRSQG